MYTHIYIHIFRHMRMLRLYECIYVYVCTRYTYMYTHMYIHIYRCMRLLRFCLAGLGHQRIQVRFSVFSVAKKTYFFVFSDLYVIHPMRAHFVSFLLYTYFCLFWYEYIFRIFCFVLISVFYVLHIFLSFLLN